MMALLQEVCTNTLKLNQQILIMVLTTYIPQNLLNIQLSSVFVGLIVAFLFVLVFIATYYFVFGVDKRKVPEEFRK